MQHFAQATSKNSRMAPDSDAPVAENTLFKIVILFGLLYMMYSGRLNVVFDFGEEVETATAQLDAGTARHTSLWGGVPTGKAEKAQKQRKTIEGVELPKGALNNLTFAMDPGYAKRNEVAPETVQKTMAACRDYVERFAPVATAESRKYGIPASITLAQGLLESNAGNSKLAKTTNNHFGMKCFSRNCGRGHCANFSDDTHKDFFLKYKNVWGSYRAHSEFLSKAKRYEKLFKLKKNDYRSWAHGLSKCGYATDPKYAQKLIAIIQSLDLQKYD